MCHLITIICKSYDSLRNHFPREIRIDSYDRSFPHKNIEEKLFTITSNGCSCDFYSNGKVDTTIKENDLLQKYKKKGWSDAKIERVLAQKEKAVVETNEFNGLRQDIYSHIEKLSGCKFFIHYYSGNISDEPLELQLSGNLPIKENIKPDIIYKIP